jgi:hypothetical protein
MLAREAATGGNGMRIPPLVNFDKKGGAYQIVFQQFKRAIEVAIVQGNAKHKLGHFIMYVSLWRRRQMRVLPTIVLTNGTQATTDMLVGIMPIHKWIPNIPAF